VVSEIHFLLLYLTTSCVWGYDGLAVGVWGHDFSVGLDKILIVNADAPGMVEIKLFTKNNCGKCDHVKERLPKNLKIEVLNVDTVDGLAEGAYYEVLDKGFPVLVVDDERVAEDAVPVLKKLTELAGQ